MGGGGDGVGGARAMGIQGKFVAVLILNSLQFCCEENVCMQNSYKKSESLRIRSQA